METGDGEVVQNGCLVCVCVWFFNFENGWGGYVV